MDCYKIHIFEDTDVDYIFNPDVKWGNISGDIHQQGDLMDLLDDITSGSVTLSEKIDEISGAVYTLDEWADKMSDDLESLSGEVIEIIDDYLTMEELEEMDYLTESAASETYQPITQFKTINNNDITGGTDNIEIYYDDTQVKADIQKLSGDIQTIVGGDFVTEDDLSAYTTVEYAEATYLKEIPTEITNQLEELDNATKENADNIDSISGQIQSIVDGDFIVTFTRSNNVYSADKTIEEINAAADAGKRVIGKLYTYPSWHSVFYLTHRRTGNGAYAIFMSEAATLSTGYDPQMIDKGIWYILLTNEKITTYVNYFNEYAKLEDVSGFSTDIQSISAQVQTISGDYLTQDDLTPYATTAFTESTYLKEVPTAITSEIQVISGQVESLGNTVVSNSQNIQSLSGKVNTISGQVQTISGEVETLQNTPFVQEGDDISVLINDAGYLLPSSLKTINKMSLIGNGDITIGTGETYDDTEIQQKVATVSGQVQTVSGQVQSISGKVNTVSGSVQSLSGQVQTLSGSLDDYLTESAASQTYQLKTQFRTINGSAITGDNTNIVIEGGSEYSGGSNIDITNNVISVTGITVPTKVSDLTNDSGYLTKASGDTIYQPIGNYLTKASADTLYATQADLASVSGDIPTKVSDLNNDSGYLVASDLKTINNASIVGSGNIVVPQIWIGTQAQYEALPSYDNNTIYCIEKEN